MARFFPFKRYSGKASAQSVKETFTCLLEARYDPCEVLGTALLSYPHLQRRIKLEIARQCHFNEQPSTGDAVMSGEGEESAEESNNRDADRSKGTPRIVGRSQTRTVRMSPGTRGMSPRTRGTARMSPGTRGTARMSPGTRGMSPGTRGTGSRNTTRTPGTRTATRAMSPGTRPRTRGTGSRNTTRTPGTGTRTRTRSPGTRGTGSRNMTRTPGTGTRTRTRSPGTRGTGSRNTTRTRGTTRGTGRTGTRTRTPEPQVAQLQQQQSSPGLPAAGESRGDGAMVTLIVVVLVLTTVLGEF